VEGLEKMLLPFPLFGITLGAVRRDVRSAKAFVVGFLPSPAPVKGTGRKRLAC